MNKNDLIAYHGSHNSKLKMKPKSLLFFTSNKDDAKNWANAWLDGGLATNQQPYIYTAKLSLKNPYVIKDENEFEDIIGDEQYKEYLDNGYDSFIYKISNDIIYYIITNPNQYEVIDISETLKLDEMAYPTNFNLQVFSNINTFKARKQYCDDRLEKIGKGSSRIAYKVDNEKALKLAFNQKGIAQNRAECDWFKNNYEVFGKVYEADTDNYYWVEMELARKPKQSDFKTILGISWVETCDLIKYCFELNSKYSYLKTMYYSTMVEQLYEKMVINEESDFFVSFQQYVYDYQPFSVLDYTDMRNWGVVNRNGTEQLVIIDTGLDEEVYNQFYRRK